MVPPEAPVNGSSAANEAQPPAVSVCLNVLKKRASFLACARARKQPAPAFLLQARNRGDDTLGIGIGFTASKKVGNAVARNRAKRRLRALARTIMPNLAKPGWDYVLVARKEATAHRLMADMERDLARALQQIHAPRKS